MAADKSTKIDGRARHFACIVYPESAPDNWKDILASHFVPAFVSPLHSDDVNPTGEKKKAHYHVIFMFDGKKSIEQVTDIFKTFGGVGCEHVKSIRGYARYLCHLDNPDKAQYNTADVWSLGGADYLSTIGLAIDKYIAISEMEDFCDRYNVVSFYALSKYARNYRQDWHRVLADNATVYMREYLQSKKWSDENGLSNIVDPETGEILV